MLAEVMIAAKTISTVASGTGRIFGGGAGKSHGTTGAPGARGADGSSGFFKGGLIGMAYRKAGNDAVKMATSSKHTSATHTASATSSRQEQSSQTDQAAYHASSIQQEQSYQVESQGVSEHESSQTTHTSTSAQSVKAVPAPEDPPSPASVSPSPPHMSSIGAAVFMSSLHKGGDFANNVIGRVAKGDIRTTGSITGDMAAQSMMSYMGYTALGEKSLEKVSYREVEMGGGQITGIEVTRQHPEGIAFGMYHADQYARPEGDFTKVTSADGAQWYKQYAVDSVKKTPYKAPDGEVAYRSEIVKKLPQPPKRKDRS